MDSRSSRYSKPGGVGTGIPAGFKAEQPLIFNGIYPESLKFVAYYKQSHLSGVPAKLSLSLCYRGVRVYGLDENGAGFHRNDVGLGRAMHGAKIPYPHEHTPSRDGGYVGYAEAIQRIAFADLWQLFLTKTNIEDAPSFALPPGQLELLP